MALNPNNPRDAAWTSLTCSWTETNIETGVLELHTNSFDCWGRLQAHQWHTTTPEYASRNTGLRSHLTLSMLKQGCCPEWFTAQLQRTEGDPVRDPCSTASAQTEERERYLAKIKQERREAYSQTPPVWHQR